MLSSSIASVSWTKNGPSPAGSVGVNVQLVASGNETGTKSPLPVLGAPAVGPEPPPLPAAALPPPLPAAELPSLPPAAEPVPLAPLGVLPVPAALLPVPAAPPDRPPLLEGGVAIPVPVPDAPARPDVPVPAAPVPAAPVPALLGGAPVPAPVLGFDIDGSSLEHATALSTGTETASALRLLSAARRGTARFTTRRATARTDGFFRTGITLSLCEPVPAPQRPGMM